MSQPDGWPPNPPPRQPDVPDRPLSRMEFPTPAPGSYATAVDAWPGTGRSRAAERSRLLLSAFLAMVILVVGGGAAMLIIRGVGRDAAGRTGASTNAAAAPAAVPSPSDDAVAREAARIRLVAPKKLSGKPKMNQPELKAVIESVRDGLRKNVPESTDAVGAYYGDAEQRDVIMVVAVAAVIPHPELGIKSLFEGFGTKDTKLRDITAVDPGPLGGSANCADGQGQPGKFGLCGWVDHGSLGLIYGFGRTADETEADFAEMRGQIEKKS